MLFRSYASIMGAKAIDLLAEGAKNRVVVYRNGIFTDYDIDVHLDPLVFRQLPGYGAPLENPCGFQVFVHSHLFASRAVSIALITMFRLSFVFGTDAMIRLLVYRSVMSRDSFEYSENSFTPSSCWEKSFAKVISQ